MRDDFCAFILTHGRPDKVLTYRTLRRAGYTGKIFIVVDDEDKTRHQYMAEFGEQVLVFSKADIASRFDEADNFGDRRSIFYARNACFDLAKLVGCKYFIQLDDDYHEFQFRVDRNYDQAYFPIRKLDAILSEMLAYYESIMAEWIGESCGGNVDVRTELDVSAQVFDSSSALAVQSLRQGGDPASVSFRIAAPAAPSRIELTPGYFQITATPHLAVYDPTVQFEFWFSEKRIADIRQVETTARYLGTALYWIRQVTVTSLTTMPADCIIISPFSRL